MNIAEMIMQKGAEIADQDINSTEDIKIQPGVEEPEFDSPNGSRWIVAVADDGTVSVLSKPFIHDSFFENGSSPEDMGLPCEVDGEPGVYEWICNLVEYRDWETGYVDDYQFEVIEEKRLYQWQS